MGAELRTHAFCLRINLRLKTMIKKILHTTSILLILICASPALLTAENSEKEQMPAANVVVSRVTTGMIAPEQEFIGTIYYLEVSDVSTEVSGAVEVTKFEEGQRITRGKALVKLNSNLLEKRLQARVASYEQVFSDLERAQNDFERIENLFKKKIVAEKDYEDQWFQVKGLEKKAAALKADVEQLEIELKKTLITAPFNGVIIKKHVARGEWLSPGKTVATIARDDAMDLIVEVPQGVIKYLKPGMTAMATAAGTKKSGIIMAIIPKGNIATRTFPVKIRINDPTSLMEGMEARVRLPVGERINTLMVPRDAVINMIGKTVIFAVVDQKARIILTQVVGYKGMKVGINARNISEGMKVVVKGNERLRNEQPVYIIKEVN
ncbi:efflux RND transporter periplasmic adaptor subunit [bacterium]|nr:efflux RND transporter periplasmic adaptor subunit [bacterium]